MKGISFCIPTWNRTKLLVKAVDSVLDQDKLDRIPHEIIVSADSDDEISEEVINSRYKGRVVFIKNKVKGQFNNLNNLIEEARYEWLVFLHDDDMLSRYYVQEVFVNMKEEELEGLEVVYTGRQLVNREGRRVGEQIVPLKKGESWVFDGYFVLDKILSGTAGAYHPMVTGLAVKRDLVLRVGCFNNLLKINSDGLFLNKALFLAGRVKFMNKPLVNYLVAEGTERGKVSREGIAYEEMRKKFDLSMEFMEKNWEEVMGDYDFKGARNYYLNKFVSRVIKINGPFLWTALGYEGSWIDRIKIFRSIISDLIKINFMFLFNPKFWFVFVFSLLPRRVLSAFSGLYIRMLPSYDV